MSTKKGTILIDDSLLVPLLMVKTKMEINNTNVMTKPRDYMKNELRNTIKVIKWKTHVRYPSGTPKRDDS